MTDLPQVLAALGALPHHQNQALPTIFTNVSRSVTAVYKINSRRRIVETLWRETVLFLASVVHKDWTVGGTTGKTTPSVIKTNWFFQQMVIYHVKSTNHPSENWRLIFKNHDRPCGASNLWVLLVCSHFRDEHGKVIVSKDLLHCCCCVHERQTIPHELFETSLSLSKHLR